MHEDNEVMEQLEKLSGSIWSLLSLLNGFKSSSFTYLSTSQVSRPISPALSHFLITDINGFSHVQILYGSEESWAAVAKMLPFLNYLNFQFPIAVCWL